MKVKRLLPERAGAHLMQLGLNHWALVGRESVTLRRIERDGMAARWEVSMDNLTRSTWEIPMAALAHAYALATGHSEI